MARVGTGTLARPSRAQLGSCLWSLQRWIRDKVSVMEREISAGGVVLQQISGVWHVALIEPRKDEPQINEPQTESLKPASSKTPRKRSRAMLTLPKGLVAAAESPQASPLLQVL